jgi:peptidoglycan/LPS O-acetylase OafA/YrhL
VFTNRSQRRIARECPQSTSGPLLYTYPQAGIHRRLLGLGVIAITFAIAELSWRFIEKPVLALKGVPIGRAARPRLWGSRVAVILGAWFS